MDFVTVQIHHHGGWHDAARVEFLEPDRGVRGATRTTYDDDYFFDFAAEDAFEKEVRDRRAVSLGRPVDLTTASLTTWPSWLLDLMPQGGARQRLSQEIGMAPNDPAVELPLLKRAGSTPIGNLRIYEAWRDEQRRIEGVNCPPLHDSDIAERSDLFVDVIGRFGQLASGSSGVQGEWPKALLTRSSRDQLWYPDPFVPTDEGCEHVIVKLLKSSSKADRLILASEAPYLELARAFGLRVGAPLVYTEGVLSIPRFDRTVLDGQVLLHGQESLISAAGVAAFGHMGEHEDYLEVIRRYSDQPAADTLEYVIRDVLDMATGNPDNHGRNTAFSKGANGGIQLSPIFDFAPMKMADEPIARATRWRCLEGRDMNGNWDRICDAAACPGMPPETLKTELKRRLPFLQNLEKTGVQLGVPQEVVNRAFRAQIVIKSIAEI